MSNEDIPQWTEDECERLVGHCWDVQASSAWPPQRKCRHCGRKEEHVWVNTGLKVK